MPEELAHLQEMLAERYRIERLLGAGGMASVYLAQDLKHQRQVAIKVLRSELGTALGPERFLREIEIAARLRHPHILPLFDSGAAGGLFYYVMPYVEGESLRERLAREKQLPIADAVRIAREVADALSYAHSRDVVHRDIKPENILLESGHAVVADFGIARAIRAAGGERLTQTGVVIGTPAYMSPEQGLGEDADQRTDLYSLGTVLYEMLAGSPPFSGATAQAVLARKAIDPPPPLRSVRDTISVPLEQTVLKALARAPADRFASAGEFTESLDRPAATSTRRPRVRAGSLAAIIVLLTGLGGVLVLSKSSRPPGSTPTILAAVEGTAPAEVRLTVESLVRAALDQGNVLVPLGADEIREGLRRMLRPDSLALDAAAARELAYRGSVRTVVLPSLEQVGQSFALTLRVVDAETGKVVATGQTTTGTEDGLISASDEAVRAVQRRLGVPANRLATEQLPAVTTASFEAYRKLVRAGGLPTKPAAVLLREALALDSSFAAAWARLAVTYGNVGERDSMLSAMAHLERHLDRVSEREKLEYRAAIATARSDYVTLLDLADRLLRDYGPEPGALTTRGVALFSLGRTEEAVQLMLRSMAISRYGVARGQLGNLIQSLLVLGRPQEAQRLTDSIRTACGPSCAGYFTDPGFRREMAMILDDWDLADSLASVTKDPYALAAVKARRGELRSAGAALAGGGPGQGIMPDLARLLVELVRGPPWSRPEMSAGHDALHGLAWNGVWEALAGDSGSARTTALGLRDSFPNGYRGAMPEFIEAAIEARGGRWSRVISLLEPVAARPETGRVQLDLWIHALPMRWLLALAYDRANNLDSAVTKYERVLWPGGAVRGPLSLRGIPYSFVHQRLVILYSRLGRLEEANRHYKTFIAAFKNPDPNLKYLIDEARTAIRR